MEKNETKIWIDADACPKAVKEVVFKFSARLKIKVILVANSYMNIPFNEYVEFVKVDSGADVADKYIAEHADIADLVITADIPLASDIVNKGALAINPRGELYDEENISERLSMRDFMKDLRDNGLVTGGPESYSDKNKIDFTNSLHKILTRKGYK
ncbi:YaiI/YqxD family protein [Bacteriovorax sp. DB6_IX]|uniref:YaiI/YqxD family protein n=1 Tax=Bacteriovorax sp. DB6_IX TaxID=1353530 RepID=UPI00038A1136|nr:YaiI/YqxD family protein [Bacteriovorax sp. DB6_IX]EQC51786.1 PIN domain protein, PF02639 family [Bacteriovorax sp. DB6_IX]